MQTHRNASVACCTDICLTITELGCECLNYVGMAFPLRKQTLRRLKTVRAHPQALGGGSG